MRIFAILWGIAGLITCMIPAVCHATTDTHTPTQYIPKARSTVYFCKLTHVQESPRDISTKDYPDCSTQSTKTPPIFGPHIFGYGLRHL
jgi:hypothetical protein